jgi:hypothetical protein
VPRELGEAPVGTEGVGRCQAFHFPQSANAAWLNDVVPTISGHGTPEVKGGLAISGDGPGPSRKGIAYHHPIILIKPSCSGRPPYGARHGLRHCVGPIREQFDTNDPACHHPNGR